MRLTPLAHRQGTRTPFIFQLQDAEELWQTKNNEEFQNFLAMKTQNYNAQ